MYPCFSISLFLFIPLLFFGPRCYSQWGQGTAWQGASRQATAGHDMARRGMARLDCSFVFLSSFCECLRPNCKSDGLSFDWSVMSAARSQFWCVVVVFSSRFFWMSAAELQVWWFELWFFSHVCGQIVVLMFCSFVVLSMFGNVCGQTPHKQFKVGCPDLIWFSMC